MRNLLVQMVGDAGECRDVIAGADKIAHVMTSCGSLHDDVV